MKYKLKLEQKISIMVLILILFSISISVTASAFWNLRHMEEQLSRNALNIVQITAMSPIVIEALEHKDEKNNIQELLLLRYRLLKISTI